ncbi:DUF1996 domain-containing protein [Aquihabitans daechungensis]|uniref:DUF1996 domain-containing protein n=1 Tax=Aquihabitans daechungensis TaxID=1052257 RepID=UPI003BA20B43
MSTGRRRALVAVLGVAAVIAVAVSAAVALGGGSDDTASQDAAPWTERAIKPAGPELPAAPERWIGPQGRTGQFVAGCRYTHSGPNDPIVHFGMKGMSHQHDFYGAVGTDQDATPEEMAADDTTCDKQADTAAYWHPALYDGDDVVEPLDLHAYYRAAPGVDPQDVEPFPFGLALIAGDQTATTPQAGEATGWTCGSRTHLSDDPPVCPATAPLHLVLTFQDCWDGAYLDSEDHQSHATYSRNGICPATHPVHIPQLTASIRFPIWGEGHDLRLASGNIYSAHGDFLNAWQPRGLQREIDGCIKRGVVCDLASNREEEDLFASGPLPTEESEAEPQAEPQPAG